MLSAVSRLWRVFGTGLSFAAFGVGGLVLYAVALPLLKLAIRDVPRRQRVARRLVHSLFIVFVRFMRAIGVLTFEFVRPERLRRPGLVIVANHPTLLDVVFLISLVPDANCIVKAALASNPFTRAAVLMTGYVCNDWGMELVEDCVRCVRTGSSLIIFPEGTRTSAQTHARWHRGAANIALRAGVALTPVSVSCVPPSLRKGEPWWQVPPRRMHYRIEVMDDVTLDPAHVAAMGEAVAARGLTSRLRELLDNDNENNLEQNIGA